MTGDHKEDLLLDGVRWRLNDAEWRIHPSALFGFHARPVDESSPALDGFLFADSAVLLALGFQPLVAELKSPAVHDDVEPTDPRLPDEKALDSDL